MTFARILLIGSTLALPLVALPLVGSAVAGEPSHQTVASEESDEALEAMIAQLDADTYAARKMASQWILTQACSRTESENVRGRLVLLRSDGSFEQRIAAGELLARIDHRQRLSETPSSTFRQHAGDDSFATDLYRSISDRFGKWLSLAYQNRLDRDTWQDVLPLSKLSRDDHVGWAALLHIEMVLDAQSSSSATMSSREAKIRQVLGHPAMGIQFGEHSRPFGHEPVLGRMIESYLRHGNRPPDRNCVMAACRYGRLDFLIEQTDHWLEDPHCSAANLGTAMLALLAVAPENMDSHLERLLSDHRIAHVWQSVESGPDKIETRISDIARAIQLHRRGLDPRGHGFDHLKADPWLVYAPYSLGSIRNASARTAMPNPRPLKRP